MERMRILDIPALVILDPPLSLNLEINLTPVLRLKLCSAHPFNIINPNWVFSNLF